MFNVHSAQLPNYRNINWKKPHFFLLNNTTYNVLLLWGFFFGLFFYFSLFRLPLQKLMFGAVIPSPYFVKKKEKNLLFFLIECSALYCNYNNLFVAVSYNSFRLYSLPIFSWGIHSNVLSRHETQKWWTWWEWNPISNDKFKARYTKQPW